MQLPTRAELVTMVIPARNEEATIGACLDSVLAQDWPDLQVLVVDGGSTDGTLAVIGDRARRLEPAEVGGRRTLSVVSNPRQVIPVAMNLGLAAAKGAWLVRVDAHSTIPPDYVRRLVTHLRTGRYGGAGGRKDGIGTTPAGRAIAAAMGSRFGVGGSTYHWGTEPGDVEHVPFGAYPVALLRAMGGWDETVLANEDFELDYRLRQAGHRVYFDPQVRIAWHCRQTVPDLFRQYHRYGKGKARVARLHPASLRFRHLAPPVLVAGLAAAAIVGLRRPTWTAAVAAPYLAGVGVASFLTGRSLDPAARLHLPGAFVAMHIGWGSGFLRQVVRPARETEPAYAEIIDVRRPAPPSRVAV